MAVILLFACVLLSGCANKDVGKVRASPSDDKKESVEKSAKGGGEAKAREYSVGLREGLMMCVERDFSKRNMSTESIQQISIEPPEPGSLAERAGCDYVGIVRLADGRMAYYWHCKQTPPVNWDYAGLTTH